MAWELPRHNSSETGKKLSVRGESVAEPPHRKSEVSKVEGWREERRGSD